MKPSRWWCVLGGGLVLLVSLVPLGPAPAAADPRPAAGPAAPASSAAALREGARLFHEGRLQEAEAAVTGVLRARPADPHGWLWLGAIRYHRGDVQWAAQAFDYVARRQPRNAAALLWLGYALVRAGRVSEAEAAFRRVLLLPAEPRAHDLARQALRATRPVPAAVRGPQAAAWVTDVGAYQWFARHYNPRLGLQDARRIGEALLGYSRLFNVDPRLIVALVVVESGFQVRVRSRAGAIGLGQLMPETARALGVDPEDPVQNLYGTIRYLRGNLDRFGWDNLHLALAAYNAGRGAVERYQGIPPYDETRWYVLNVTNLYRRLLVL